MISNSALLWLTSHENLYEMIALRGYVPKEGSEKVDNQTFLEKYETWINARGVEAEWLEFEYPDDPNEPDTKVAFITSKISGEQFPPSNIITYIEHEISELKAIAKRENYPHNRKNLSLNFIIITNEITGPAASELRSLAPKPDKRLVLNENFSPSLEVLNFNDLQINPVKFCMQPAEIVLIKDELQKEELRKHLVQAIIEKEKTLEELLPMIRFGRPLTLWYGAKVGDVFYFRREIGGLRPYYRIVVPEPPTKDNSRKKKKVVTEEDDE